MTDATVYQQRDRLYGWQKIKTNKYAVYLCLVNYVQIAILWHRPIGHVNINQSELSIIDVL